MTKEQEWRWDDETGTAGQWLLNLSGFAKPWTREQILSASRMFGRATINGVTWRLYEDEWIPDALLRD